MLMEIQNVEFEVCNEIGKEKIGKRCLQNKEGVINKARRMSWKRRVGAKRNKENSSVVKRELEKQGKGMKEEHEVDESEYNGRYVEGSRGKPQSTTKTL